MGSNPTSDKQPFIQIGAHIPVIDEHSYCNVIESMEVTFTSCSKSYRFMWAWRKVAGFCGVVVITSALHAEGREFEPRQNLEAKLLSSPV